MKIEDINRFKEIRPEVQPYAAEAKAEFRSRLAAEMRGSARVRKRRSFRPGSGMKVALAGAVTAVAIVVPVAVFSDRSEPPARTRPDMQPASEWPRPGQWYYVKTQSARSSKGTGGMLFGPPDRRVTDETWWLPDGSKSTRVVKGKLKVGPGTPAGTQPRTDLAYLKSLPTDPDKLLAFIYKESKDAPLDSKHTGAFNMIEVLYRERTLPVSLRKALYGAATRIPDVKIDAKVKDSAGRTGTGLYRIAEGWIRDDIIVNPNTFEYMGHRAMAIRKHTSRDTAGLTTRSKKGDILGWSAQLANGIVDAPGTRPR